MIREALGKAVDLGLSETLFRPRCLCLRFDEDKGRRVLEDWLSFLMGAMRPHFGKRLIQGDGLVPDRDIDIVVLHTELRSLFPFDRLRQIHRRTDVRRWHLKLAEFRFGRNSQTLAKDGFTVLSAGNLRLHDIDIGLDGRDQTYLGARTPDLDPGHHGMDPADFGFGIHRDWAWGRFWGRFGFGLGLQPVLEKDALHGLERDALRVREVRPGVLDAEEPDSAGPIHRGQHRPLRRRREPPRGQGHGGMVRFVIHFVYQ